MAVALTGVLSVGCVDAEGEYEDFKERDEKTTIPGGTGCGDTTGPCNPVPPGGLDGQWLFALSATLAPTKPILFFADIVSNESGGQLNWTWTITPINATDGTPLTPLPELPTSTIPEGGAWSADLPPLAVPGAANPITGSDIEADTALAGNICGDRDFMCGDLSGQVTKPLELDLAGSTWTLARLDTPDTVPPVVYINCQCSCAENRCPTDGGTN